MISIDAKIKSLKIGEIEYIKNGVDMTDKERIEKEIERCECLIEELELRFASIDRELSKAVNEREILKKRLKEIEEIEEKPCDDVDGNEARYEYTSSYGHYVASYNTNCAFICCGPYRPTKQEAKEIWEKMMRGAKQ